MIKEGVRILRVGLIKNIIKRRIRLGRFFDR